MLRFGKKRLGLALGGGAARGLAHIGVLRAFEEAAIPISFLTGTSMGAIIGGMYAARPQIGPLQVRFEEYLESDLFRKARLDFVVDRENVDGEGLFFRFSQLARKNLFYTLSMTRLAFVSQETTDKSFDFLLPDVAIEHLTLPFAASALDLYSGREVVLQSGPLRRAVAATSALPGVLPPVEHNGRLLVDGGWINAVPVSAARRLGADLVVAVDVGCELAPAGNFSRGLDVVFRADAAARNALADLQLEKADLVILPEVGSNHWADFSRSDLLIEKGYQAACRQMPKLKKLLRGSLFGVF